MTHRLQVRLLCVASVDPLGVRPRVSMVALHHPHQLPRPERLSRGPRAYHRRCRPGDRPSLGSVRVARWPTHVHLHATRRTH